jgi:MoxR-like ATPase
MKLTTKQKQFIETAKTILNGASVVTRADIHRVVTESGISYPHWLVTKTEFRYDRGQYKLPEIDFIPVQTPVEVKEPELTVDMAQVLHLRQPKLIDESDSAIPEKYKDYVKFGFFNDLKNIISSNMFYPVFITGLSGNGKTLMVEQVCAVLKRECIRVNISIETDESDLLGGPTLVNGNVVNRDGPVLLAMKKGAVLLIDEVDRGSNKLMCLQGILEGKPYYNKKTGEVVHPASGFNVIATANAKGRGSEEGRYLSQILDDAFLERFPITVEQEYPDIKTERKILTPLIDDVEFVETLTKWADIVRQSFDQGATDEVISTRRLVHIAKAFSIFKDRKKAIELCVNRFDNETKLAFLDLYSKVEPFSVSGDYQNMKIESENNDDFPF